MTKKFTLLLVLILLFKAIAIIGLIISGYIGLGPDEAQYWTWSQKLNWGYYSKPPGIAWQIWMGTLFFGDTELGVRIGAVAIGILLPLAVYALAAACRLKPLTCFMAAIFFALSPLGFASSFLAITDGGLVLFWALATAVFCDALSNQKAPSYLLIGGLILLGALFKWPIYIFWIFVLGWLLFQRQYFNRTLFAGILLSLVGLLPSLIWNSQHDWATFRHVFSTLYLPNKLETGTTELMQGNLLEFLGAQATLLSPLLFLLLVVAFWQFLRCRKELSHALIFCGSVPLILLLAYCGISIFKKLQGNWCDFAYPSAVVILSWFVCEHAPKMIRWAYAGIALSLLLIAILISIPYMQSKDVYLGARIPFKSNPFKHNLGWEHLHSGLADAGFDPSTQFLFADRYQISSILSFYGDQDLAYFFNLHGIRKNQFSYWEGMDKSQIGRTGYFIHVENSTTSVDGNKKIILDYQTLLHPYFSTIEYVKLKPLFYCWGVISKEAYIFKCSNYNGEMPSETFLY